MTTRHSDQSLRRIGGRLAFVLALVAMAFSGVASSQVITEFPIPTADSGPEGVVTGPDGNLWFAEEFGNKIGRREPNGTITEFPIPTPDSAPETIVVGPDGNLWFTELEGNKIGRITTAGVITEFPIPTADSEPEGITTGPDGNIWFTEAAGKKIGRLTMAGVFTEFVVPTGGAPRPEGITMGPDGNLWFVEQAGNKVGRITTQGVITEFPIPTFDSDPWNITAGPDGNLWFSEGTGTKIGRITTSGVITEFPIASPGATPDYITTGPDGNVWFSMYHGDKIGRITMAGDITEFPLPDTNSKPYGITTGADGAMWFAEAIANQIGRITTAPSVPKLMVVDEAGNGVFEPGETAQVAPTWENTLTSSNDLSGSASNLTGPGGPTYSIIDGSADYGTVPAESSANCDDTGNCYSFSISGARPIQHWDATFTEDVSPGPITKNWTLHVGESFPDVLTSNQFYSFIETLFHSGVTGGCGNGNYCPASSVTRAQMAIFLLKGKFGPAQLYPPPTGAVFNDVTPATFGASWIESLAGFLITGGCGGGNYCPNSPVTRGQMAVFLLKAKHGSAFVPPTCTGVFDDVACPGNQFADWIEQLAEEGITGGCGGNNYCPFDPVTRGQMAVFLVRTFGLELYGP